MKETCDFLKLAAERYSVRAFAKSPLDPNDLEQILEAGRLAPTARNFQPQRVLVIESEDALARLRRSTKCHFDAPAALLVCVDTDACWKRSYDGKASGDIDAAIVTTHMMLAAHALGVGATWVMFFDPVAMRKEFAVPDAWEPVALLVLGYPAADAEPNPRHMERRTRDELVYRNCFDGKPQQGE